MSSFDQIINRRGTDCLKYDFAVQRGKPADILPLWVADMDFKAPAPVLEALAQRVEHGIFGYSDAADDRYFEALADWYSSRFQWKIQPEWLLKAPSVVFALCVAIRALTHKGDAVIVQQPVYYPFSSTVVENNRKLVVNQLVERDGVYSIDFDAFEREIVENQVKLFILCSPHNPAGRVWTKEELTAMGDICVRHGVYVIADEIHADFIYPGYKHLVFADLNPAYAELTITCTSPSKTFNLAGLQIANLFISNEALRQTIVAELHRTGYDQPNVMGLVACQAAYQYGGPWLEELMAYLTSNVALVRKFLVQELPGVRLVEPEGTYLLWLDFRALGLSDEELNAQMVEKAGLWLNAGPVFGAGGQGFQRINIACPQATLQTALDRLKHAFSK